MKSDGLPSLIGVIHLPALPGAPEAAGLDPSEALAQARNWAVQEAKILAKAGYDGIIIENFGDAPFYKTQVGPETIAAMAVIASAIRAEKLGVKLGINVLRNDGRSALAIAAVSGAEFIRVNVLSGVSATDQGLIEGEAAELVREKIRLGAKTRILADVHVKHARSLSSTSLTLAIEETAARGGADGIIVTGATTGRTPDGDDLKEALQACRHLNVPLYIGSGARAENLSQFSKEIRIIVGSDLRKGGKAGAPLDRRRTENFAATFRRPSGSRRSVRSGGSKRR